MTRRLLLISPVFHGYWRSVADALSRSGYEVITHLYDARSATSTLRHKVAHELPTRLGFRHTADARPTAAATNALRSSSADVVVVIRGDEFQTDFWSALADHGRSVLWLYDEVRRTGHTDETLSAATAIASYSPHDVESFRATGLRAIHVPNAFDPTITVGARARTGDVTFVGARYANRDALLRQLDNNGIPVRAYGRDWSDHPIDRARTWRLRRVGIPNGRDVPRPVAYGIMAASDATLNMHFDQDGFTMRTFEAAGVGAVQLIDRADVAGLYEPDTEIAVFSSPEEAIELARRAQRDPVWANRIRERGRRRTLAEHTFDHRVTELETLWQ